VAWSHLGPLEIGVWLQGQKVAPLPETYSKVLGFRIVVMVKDMARRDESLA
jgi:hypothetical protein